MHSSCGLTGRVEAYDRGGLAVGLHADASHRVMAGGAHLHRGRRDVDVGELLELVVHGGQQAANLLGSTAARDVEEDAAVRASPARFHLRVDRAGHLVTGKKVGWAAKVLLVLVPLVRLLDRVGGLCREERRDVVEHEALAVPVLQDPAVTSHPLGHEQAACRRRPDHPRRVELDGFHVDQVGTGPQREGHPVTGALPRVGREPPRLAEPAGGDDDRLGAEGHETPGLAPEADGPVHGACVVLQEPYDLALHEDVDPDRHGAVLQGPDHLETGPVAHMGEAGVAMAAEVPLQDPAVGCAVEQCAPLLELEDAIGGLEGVDLSHAPVVEHLAAADGVAEVDLPVVLGPHAAECRGDAALGHHGVRLSEEGLAHKCRAGSHLARFDGRPQARSTGADDDHVEVVPFGISHQKILGSLKVPDDTR